MEKKKELNNKFTRQENIEKVSGAVYFQRQARNRQSLRLPNKLATETLGKIDYIPPQSSKIKSTTKFYEN